MSMRLSKRYDFSLKHRNQEILGIFFGSQGRTNGNQKAKKFARLYLSLWYMIIYKTDKTIISLRTFLQASIGDPLMLVITSEQAGPHNMMITECTATRVGGFGDSVPFTLIENG